MNKMSITYIVEPRRVIGGGVRAALNLIEGLEKFYSISANIWGVYEMSIMGGGDHIFTVKYTGAFSLKYFRDFHSYIKNERPDVIHCFGLYTLLMAIVYKKLFRGKYYTVCTLHRFTNKIRFGKISKILNKYLARNVDYVTFLTNSQMNHYINIMKFAPLNCSVIPNVIFPNMNSSDDWREIRKVILEETKAQYLITYVGRLIPDKNLEDFIKIIAITRRDGINAIGMIVGGGEDGYIELLHEVAEKEGIMDYIKFVGFVDTPMSYIKASDIILTPTKREALPNLIVESFSLGKIVIVSSIPQLDKIVINGVNGFMAPLDDLMSFKNIIKEVIQSEDLQGKIRIGAIKTYEESYDPQVVTKKYFTIYKNLYEG